MSETETVKYAMYSATATGVTHTSIWELEDGREVEVTAIVSDPDNYKFDDAINYGPAKKYVRSGQDQPRFRNYLEGIPGEPYRDAGQTDLIKRFDQTLKDLGGKYTLNLKTEGEPEEEVTPGPKF